MEPLSCLKVLICDCSISRLSLLNFLFYLTRIKVPSQLLSFLFKTSLADWERFYYNLWFIMVVSFMIHAFAITMSKHNLLWDSCVILVSPIEVTLMCLVTVKLHLGLFGPIIRLELTSSLSVVFWWIYWRGNLRAAFEIFRLIFGRWNHDTWLWPFMVTAFVITATAAFEWLWVRN